jgi:chemotaxis protein histidine kinase CheA
MKKKLEAELISIAHRILKLKNKSELIQLHQETQKLYEKLSVLRFVEENLADVKPTIGRSAIEDKIEAAFEAVPEPEIEIGEPAATSEPVLEMPAEEAKMETVAEEEVTEEQPEDITEVSEIPAEENEEIPAEVTAETEPESEAVEETPHAETTEEEKEQGIPTPAEPFFKPAFELSFDAKSENKEKEHTETVKEDAKDEFKSANAQITFEDILGSSYVDPVFVKPEDLERERETAQADKVIPIGRNFSDSPVISLNKDDSRAVTLNDRLSKGITIGLNDRVAFMKHLFANSSEDYNRVLSQLMTFDTFEEAKNFIDDMIKPDYNNWEGKDEYANRFMEIVEKKFS